MKKVAFVFFVLAVLFLPFVLSSVSDTLEQNVQKAQDVKDTVDQAQDTKYWQEKWDYLGNEWKNIFLKNPVVFAVDSIFTKISIVFLVLFGVEYSMSLALLAIVIFWIYLLFNLSRIINATGFLPGAMSYAGGSLFLIILAQFRFFEATILFFGRLAFSPEYVWTRLAILFAILVALGFFQALAKQLAVILAKQKKKTEILKEKATRKGVEVFTKNLSEFSRIGDKN